MTHRTHIDLDFSGAERRLTELEMSQTMAQLWSELTHSPKPATIHYTHTGRISSTWPAARRDPGKSVFWRSWWAWRQWPKILNPAPADEMRAAVLWAMEDLSRG